MLKTMNFIRFLKLQKSSQASGWPALHKTSWLINLEKLVAVRCLSLHTDINSTDEVTPEYDGRILHNCLLQRVSAHQARLMRRERRRRDRAIQRGEHEPSPASVFLSAVVAADAEAPAPQSCTPQLVRPEATMFPFSRVTPVEFVDESAEGAPASGAADSLPGNTPLQLTVRERVRRLRDLERREQLAADGQSYQDMEELWVLQYGQPDPSVPASHVVCGGCGANFHCQQPSWPGYMPSEVLRAAEESELRELVCQRCFYLRYHSAAVQLSVGAHDYQAMMARLGHFPALLVLVVDLLDFPCSVWPGVAQLIGRSRPVVVVGNKVDLLPQDDEHYLERVRHSLLQALERCGVDRLNVQHTCLVSARTGYGIEELITVLQTNWAAQGDVYLLGCTNTGKSTLFNALLRSDMCKWQVHDLIQRATTSRWPGTTLRLLKFPMRRPQEFHLWKRRQRLASERQQRRQEEELRHSQLLETRDPQYATLMGHIGRTFRGQRARDAAATELDATPAPPSQRLGGIGADDQRFPTGRWLYDTPGFVTDDQLIGQLTQEELLLTLPSETLRPRTFSLYRGQTLLLAGLARLDYLRGPSMVRLTVFASCDLPVTVVNTTDADDIYQQYLDSGLLAVPCGGAERLARWHGLQPTPVTVTGGSIEESAADIVLSSAGWAAVTPCEDRSGDGERQMQFTVHSPGGTGVHVRSPAVLARAVRLRGRRLRNSPAYAPSAIYQLKVADRQAKR